MSSWILPIASSFPPWAAWPPVVQHMILKALIEDGCSLARLAPVSREWQDVIEAHNFAKIKITPLRLVHFRARTRRNRFRVKYIWLCVELDNYTCCEASFGGRRCVSQSDLDLVKATIGILFAEISRWAPNGELVLDISVHSPSDSNYLLKNLSFKPDVPSRECLGLGDLGDLDDMDKAGRLWIRMLPSGQAVNSIKKTFSWIRTDSTDVTSLDGESVHEESPDEAECYYRDVGWLEQVPDVPAVTGVLLRQQTRRMWDGPLLTEMLDHFPNLRDVFYEPWRSLDPKWQDYKDQDYDHLIDEVTRQAALGSRELEQFSAAYLVNAAMFFASCRPSWTWPNLTSLSLTSSWLAPDVSRTELVKMLTSAAKVAHRMPKLETMELWNGRRRLATLFQYRPKPATITWRSTWEFDQLPSVISVWEGVAQKHGAGELAVKRELLNRTNIKCHGDAIHYLKLSHPVVRPISLQQIRTENEVHRTWEKMDTVKAQTESNLCRWGIKRGRSDL
ncbi:hypothetical protein KVR01_009217 [Diaporthe batatas]|uniref:uncharacterized protein n=1 Tax=Diaporthe batatas TaxID=748121 RepID=UPI001D05B59F|nr:uncharacterized protein KVR01_009217 [Diaporthe batatas]KAG8160953.1 hypothetical protein KVR01_009217 [Diaporthe batatas]